MVQIAVCRGGQLESTETNVVECLVVNAVRLVGVLDELVDGEGSVVRLDDRVRDLGRRNDGEGVHDSVWVLLADLGDEESAHAGSSSTAERVRQLESLEAVAGLGLFADDVEDGVD